MGTVSATRRPALETATQDRCVPRGIVASDLRVGVDRVTDALHGLVDGDAVLLAAVAEPETHRAGIAVLTARDELERNLRQRVVADLLLHALVAHIELRANTIRLQA